MVFTIEERDYLAGQLLGRLATLNKRGEPQVAPVGFRVDDNEAIVIHGHALSTTAKWRNIQRNPTVAFVVDDLPSTDPWIAQGIEIRGEAQAISPLGDASGVEESIIVWPRRVLTWGIGRKSRTARDVAKDEVD